MGSNALVKRLEVESAPEFPVSLLEVQFLCYQNGQYLPDSLIEQTYGDHRNLFVPRIVKDLYELYPDEDSKIEFLCFQL